jgi:hypothetical protein
MSPFFEFSSNVSCHESMGTLPARASERTAEITGKTQSFGPGVPDVPGGLPSTDQRWRWLAGATTPSERATYNRSF